MYIDPKQPNTRFETGCIVLVLIDLIVLALMAWVMCT